MREAIYLLIFICLISFVSAATIHGTIYDISLEKVKNVIVEVNTEPKQQYISKDGTYTFTVSVGEYIIEGKYFVDNAVESKAAEQISVKGDGDFILDLILFPAVDTELIEEAEDISINDDFFKEKPNYLLIALIIILIIVILLLFYINKKSKRLKKEEAKSEDYLNMVFGLIKKEGRTTQKEIRKQIPLSEAKISLIITELEHKGLIEKIKKGRGNILILKK